MMKSITKFIEAVNNYSPTDIDAGLKATNCPEHLESKLRQQQSKHGGSMGLFNFLPLLSDDNKEAFIKAFMNSYNLKLI